jgi:tetraacyldisaccharide 4'-kinase
MPTLKKAALLTLSWIYAAAVTTRNRLFVWGILKRKKFSIPILSLGNLIVGGTGKTPHIEYLLTLLLPHYRVAVLSRGYKRKTKGFLLANEKSTVYDIGDEPFQIHMKFPQVTVAVDAKRTRAVKRLLALPEMQRPEVILLDDAFQHRYVKPSLNILLTTYQRPYYSDRLLPLGLLREPVSKAAEADIIVVTRCPSELETAQKQEFRQKINPLPHQCLFYSSVKYGQLKALFLHDNQSKHIYSIAGQSVLLVAGIANPQPFIDYISAFAASVDSLLFPDHHHFSANDAKEINRRFNAIEDEKKLLIATEKDAARLQSLPTLCENVRKNLYYLPIMINFAEHYDKELFDEKILEHVRTN